MHYVIVYGKQEVTVFAGKDGVKAETMLTWVLKVMEATGGTGRVEFYTSERAGRLEIR